MKFDTIVVDHNGVETKEIENNPMNVRESGIDVGESTFAEYFIEIVPGDIIYRSLLSPDTLYVPGV